MKVTLRKDFQWNMNKKRGDSIAVRFLKKSYILNFVWTLELKLKRQMKRRINLMRMRMRNRENRMSETSVYKCEPIAGMRKGNKAV